MSARRPKSFAPIAATTILLLGTITIADVPILKRQPLAIPRRPFLSGVGGFGGISTLAPLFPAPRRFAVSPFNRPFSITTYHIDATPSPLLSGGGYEGQLNFLGAPSINVPALSAPNLTTGNYLDRRVYYGPPALQPTAPVSSPRAPSAVSTPATTFPPPNSPNTFRVRTQPRASVAPALPAQWRSPMRAAREDQAAASNALADARQAGVFLGRGDKAFEVKQYDQACEEYASAKSLVKDDAAVYLSLGLAQFAAGKYRQSAASLGAGLAQGKTPDRSSLDLLGCYVEQREFSRHVAALETFLSDHPTDADAWLVLTFVRYYGGDVFAARRAAQRYSVLRAGGNVEPFIKQVRAGS
jgi:hypothetical protein